MRLERFLYPGTDPDVAEAYARLPEVAAETSWGMEDEVAFLDVETTGFDPRSDAIIEVAVLVARGPKVLRRYSSLVRPASPIPLDATQLTGIDDAMVADSPSIEQVVCEVADMVGSRDIVAHNASFDRAFMTAAGARAGLVFPGEWLDSLELARIALPRLRSHRLTDLAEAFGLPSASHRAGDDTDALHALWRVALAALADLPVEVVEHIASIAPETEWPLRRVLGHIASRAPAGRFDMKRLRSERVRKARAAPLPDADGREIVVPPTDEVLSEFGPDGAVGRMYPGYERREEQLRMAEAVLGAFRDERHLAVEAATGVGKSVAYLVPAAAFTLANGVGVGVATRTIALMDQLVHSELPRLSEALGGGLRFIALKGYDHYPCLRKVDAAAASGAAPDADGVAALGAVLAWVAQTSWGDLDAINIHWGPMKTRMCASIEECTLKRCRYYPDLCYLHGVRRLASSAHIVVTNHALLFRAAAAGGMLPPLRYWVVDEAHAAEAEARRQMSASADHRALSALLGSLHSPRRPGVADAVRKRGREAAARAGDEALVAEIESLAARMRSEIDTATTITGSFFDFLKDLGDDDAAYDSQEKRVTAGMREGSAWSTAAGVGHSLARHLEAIIASGREMVSALERCGEDTVDSRADLAGVLSRLREQADALETVLDGSDESFVYSVRVRRDRGDQRDALDASLLDVGGALAERFFPDVRSVVFTSATIATGEDFSHFARTVGLDRLPGGAWESLRLESSYDLERQMHVFVPADLPEPASGMHVGPLADLLESLHVAMGGSVLTLFTNQREMEEVHDRVAPRLQARGLRLLLQGRGVSVKRVRDEFIADERVSLFATKSFWEGFDAPGDTLRCVIVARLPFGKVGDPLYQERQERYGRAAWADFYLPDAVLGLKQAAGRLIRSSTDEGCVIVADGRLSGSKPYSAMFLGSLPVPDVQVLPQSELVERVGERFGR